MKVFLINPPTGLYVREDRCQSSVGDFTVSVIRPPMDLMMMASGSEKTGSQCKIKDYPVEGGGWEDFKKYLAGFSPDILVISVTTPTLKQDMLSCRIAKVFDPKILTIAKGAHFLADEDKTLEEFPELDIVIRGENEFVLSEIAAGNDLGMIKGITYRKEGAVKRNTDRPLLEDLDQLPMPARHLVRNELYTRPDTGEPMAIIETSRGCPGNCIFCLVRQTAGQKIRNRSTAVIVNEIEECIVKYNINNFHFKSDTFTWNKAWVIELCKEILKRGLKIGWISNSRVDTLDKELLSWMKKAGCWAVGLGIESGNQEILNKIKKGITLGKIKEAVMLCKDLRIKVYAYFMIGFPWDNKQTIADTVEFAKVLGPDFVDFFLPYPFPGTELERIAKEYQLINKASSGHAYSQPVMNTLYLTADELERLKKSALRGFYLRPGYIFKTLRNIRSPKVFWNYCCYGIAVLRKTAHA